MSPRPTPTADYTSIRLPAGLDTKLRATATKRGDALGDVIRDLIDRVADGEITIDDRAGRAPHHITVRMYREQVDAAKAAVAAAAETAGIEKVSLTDALLPLIEGYIAKRSRK